MFLNKIGIPEDVLDDWTKDPSVHHDGRPILEFTYIMCYDMILYCIILISPLIRNPPTPPNKKPPPPSELILPPSKLIVTLFASEAGFLIGGGNRASV